MPDQSGIICQVQFFQPGGVLVKAIFEAKFDYQNLPGSFIFVHAVCEIVGQFFSILYIVYCKYFYQAQVSLGIHSQP